VHRLRVEVPGMKKVVILISGRGSNMEAIVRAQISGAQIAAVISNRPDAAGLNLLPRMALPRRLSITRITRAAKPSMPRLPLASTPTSPISWCWPASCACSPTVS
jgi:hypothetical protein